MPESYRMNQIQTRLLSFVDHTFVFEGLDVDIQTIEVIHAQLFRHDFLNFWGEDIHLDPSCLETKFGVDERR